MSVKSKKVLIGKLIDSIYKILCIYDETNAVPMDYLSKVIDEVYSSDEIYFKGEISDIVVKLNTLKMTNNQNKIKVKQVTLDCANKLARMRDVLLNG